MVSQLDFDSLVTGMAGENTLNGWDVLVAYPEDTINSWLSKQATSIGLMESLSWNVTVESLSDPSGTEYAVQVQFGDPILQFIEGSYSDVQLTLPINSGTYTPSKGSATSFNADLELVITTVLTNVTGTWDQNSNDWTPSSVAIPVTSGTPVDFKPDTTATQGVVINMVIDQTKNPIVLQNATGGTSSANYISIISSLFTTEPGLNNVIEKFGLNYYIAGVQADNSQGSGDVLITPQTFCFTTITDPNGIVPNTLCMWIQVENSGSSAKGSNNPVFEVKPETPITPLPTGASGCIIFSHDTMANVFLTPALKKTFDNVECTSAVGTTGMTYSFNFTSSTNPNIPKWTYSDDPHADWRDAISFSMNDNPISLTIQDQDVSANYTSNKQPTKYAYYEYNVKPGNWTEYPGTLDFVFSIKSSGKWQGPPGSASNTDSLQFSLPWDTMTYTDTPENQSIWSEFLDNATTYVPPDMQTYNPVVKQPVDMPVAAMDYFLVTNLVLPGQNIFTPDAPTGISGKGLSVPRDTILIGTLKAAPS